MVRFRSLSTAQAIHYTCLILLLAILFAVLYRHSALGSNRESIFRLPVSKN